MPSKPTKILVLCTGNSCRSIMGEALINHVGKGDYQAYSAGSHPTGKVHPQAIATLQHHGIDPGQPSSKSWNDMTGTAWDLIITVCDQAAGEACPIFSGQPQKLHWSIPDPAKASGTKADVDAAFKQAFFLLKERIEALLT
ncbi:MAG: arsenate reductase ArsC [Nitrospirota bacterium]|nr:arsenate reductase ArsC [Nitrospirota bacterium]MDH5586525.1 arsenate reductase ArsC [Nitrospirota bacterium]